MRLKNIDRLILILLLLSILFFAYNKFNKPRPHNLAILKTKIKWIDEDNIDLGKLFLEKPDTFSRKFINDGGNVLWIENIETTCGCTQAIFSSLELKPKDTCEVKGIITPKFIGKNSTSITFKANTDSIKNRITVKYEVAK